MTVDQGLAFAVIAATIGCLIWGRIRYDLVALGALLVAVACGIVPVKEAFTGFSDDIVVIVGSALVVSAAISRSGVVETLTRPLGRFMRDVRLQVPIFVGVVTLMSALIKNIGALAIVMPVALQSARQTGTSPGRLLMPMAFGSLLGGLTTLIGTSPNIIVSRMREQLVGEPFHMFDFTPVGAGLALTGIVFLAFGWRLLPHDRKAAASSEALFQIGDYTTEVSLPAKTPFVDRTVRDIEALGEGEVSVIAIIREKDHRYVPAGHWVLYAEDVLILEGDANALRKVIDAAGLVLATREMADGDTAEDFAAFEAVVTEGSVLIGSSSQELRLRDRYGVILLALRREGRRVRERLRQMQFQSGDLIVLHGRSDDMAEKLATLGCLPLAQRNLRLGSRRRMWPAVIILAAAMILVAVEAVPVTIAFFGAAVLILLSKTLTLKEAYDYVEWPILILLGALIPVSEALHSTGATDLIAGWLSQAAGAVPPIFAVGLTLAVAMLVTPFLNNAATVLVMAPIGAGVAQRLGLNIDPFLMAVAIGAGCDFLTPIGHQCNTLVMGPGGYRFGDYARLGAPLSLIILILAPLLIVQFWPLRPGG